MSTKIVLNHDGLDALMKSDEIVGILRSHAEQIAEEAGHCEVDTYYGPHRPNCGVHQHQTHEDRENNTLIKAIHYE